MAGSEYIIEIQHLCKSFDGVKVLDDINLKIRKGEFVTLRALRVVARPLFSVRSQASSLPMKAQS